MKNVYVVCNMNEYASWLPKDVSITTSLDEANFVLFCGGEDVSPELYGKKPHATTIFNKSRDKHELEIYHRARALNLPLLGICRGAQFLCVMAGGMLVQHQRHPFKHEVITHDGKRLSVTSSHHQRQYVDHMPAEDVKVLAWAPDLSPFSYGEDNQDIMRSVGGREVENAYYPKIKALAIQSHPEYVYPPRAEWEIEYVNYCKQLLNEYILS